MPLFAASGFFPLARSAREAFALASPSFSDFALARELAAKLNATRDLEREPERAVRSGRLAAAALLDEVFAHLIALYHEEVEANALEDAASFLDENIGAPRFTQLIAGTDLFFAPPELPLFERPDALELLLRLRLANENPALQSFAELFDDAPLAGTSYEDAIGALGAFFAALTPFPSHELDLLSLLREPLRAHPDSVEEQLRFVLERFGALVEPFATRILLSLDLIREEEKPVFFGPGPSLVPTYASDAEGGLVGLNEYEAFSSDTEWMPRVVLLAKQTFVWLDQLSKRYGHPIHRLDQVPDEELDELAARGITGLWLIGVWERSPASQKIKRLTGNPDALASAYSLKRYEVADSLGGWGALDNLKMRAAKRGIRMASDMVPNHTGLDSDWMIEHPDWFLSLDHPPFPSSSFDGPDLSEDGRIGLFLENGYYSKTDASVVFRRLDKSTGQSLFVYHGNDGTNMPWNDTAQLNYLVPAVREAVIQTMIVVAKHFPIIRFDAAMTLAKKHIHRLWFPPPGSGGDIPSRAGRGLSNKEFEALLPQEFWREVVDRLAVEVPGTLLLAEAFWLMEGYFVRTLGMHRVYNSAFMNMLRDEENANYRLLIKNTLEFDRDILGRFVNFMNNPDEDTAASQFGKGDKYFAVATLLATLPGLPMWGHGQVEGFEEKYGMEYPRAYWDESLDAGFIAHHESTIFPLLRKRALWAGSENFRLFDLWNGDGFVDEDVLAFSNRLGEERGLVVVNNRATRANGWLHVSAAWRDKGEDALKQETIGEALGLSPHGAFYALFRDNASGLEFLRSCAELHERGLYVDLPGYGAQVFWQWREVRDETGLYARLAAHLRGEGVPSVERALRELLLEPLGAPFMGLCDPKLWRDLLGSPSLGTSPNEAVAPPYETVEPADETVASSYEAVKPSYEAVALPDEVVEPSGEAVASSGELAQRLDEAAESSRRAAKKELERRLRAFARAASAFMSVSDAVDEFVAPTMALVERALAWPDKRKRLFWLGYALAAELGQLNASLNVRAQSRLWLDEWLLLDSLSQTWRALDVDANEWRNELRIALCAASTKPNTTPLAFLNELLADEGTRAVLKVNNFDRTLWFNAEGAQELIEVIAEAQAFEGASWPIEAVEDGMKKANYRVVKWMEEVRLR